MAETKQVVVTLGGVLSVISVFLTVWKGKHCLLISPWDDGTDAGRSKNHVEHRPLCRTIYFSLEGK